MAEKKQQQNAALLETAVIKTIHVPIIIPLMDQSFAREKIDVVSDFIDYKISSLSDPALIDQLGLVKKFGKDLEKWEKLAVAVLKTRMPDLAAGDPAVTMEGAKYIAIRTKPNRHSISLEKLKAKFGEDALEDCYNNLGVDTLNIKVRE